MRNDSVTISPSILGIDASLSSSGIAVTTFIQNIVKLHTIKTTADTPTHERLHYLYNVIDVA